MIRFLILIILLAITACSPESQQAQVSLAIAQAPINLDPRYATDAASERVNRLLYQRLVEFDVASKPMASLASWQQISPLQYQFTLKANLAAFHHGKVLTAEDVKATYDSLQALKNSPHAAEFANVSSIEVQDNHHLLFNLKLSDSHFPEKLIIGILPKDLIDVGHDFSHAPVGNGQFSFIKWDGKLELKRLADGMHLELTEVKDPTVRVLKLLRGEVDLLQGDLPPELVKYMQTQQDVTVSTSQGVNFSYLGLNMQDPILNKIKVRQALAYAIDRQSIVDSVMVNKTRLASAILPPEHYAGNATLKPYTYHPALAKELLLEAGIELPLKLVYKTSTDAQRVRLATILQAQMRPAGIELEIRSLDWGTFFEEIKQGQFQLYGLTWVGIKTPEIYTKVFGSNLTPPNGFNRGHYKDTITDDLLAKEDWLAVTQRVHAQLPYIPLWYEGQFAAYQHKIKAYQPQPDGNWDGLNLLELIH